MPVVKVKDIGVTTRKWENSFGKIPQAYAEGVNTVNDFKARALAGQDNYVRQMSDPSILESRAQALNAMPDGKWKDGAINKGTKNIVTGMNAAKQDYAAQMSKVLAVEASVNLPERGIGAEVNSERSKAMAVALEKAKKEGKFR